MNLTFTTGSVRNEALTRTIIHALNLNRQQGIELHRILSEYYAQQTDLIDHLQQLLIDLKTTTCPNAIYVTKEVL